jgi:hypothetical protein
MAFTEYVTKSANKTGMTPNTVTVAVSGKKNLSISVVIGYELLKTCGMVIGDKISLFFGTGEDKGKLLVKKTLTGILLTKYATRNEVCESHGQILRKVAPVPPIEDFAGKQLPSRVVEHTWDKDAGGLIITLPEGFFTE